MSEPDDALLGDLVAVAETEAHAAPQNAETQKQTESDTETNTVTATEDEFVGDEQDFSRQDWDERPADESEDETEEPSQTEDAETAPSTDSTEEAPVTPENDNSWLQTLPTPPPQPQLKAPEVDEDGQLLNMTPQEFIEYNAQVAVQRVREENYNQQVLNRSLEVAESILPEIKTNETIRNMVLNQVVANTLNGNNYTAVDAARDIKSLLGDAKSEGAQNTRTNITIQKNAAVESPSNQKPTKPSKADQLAKRLKSNDHSAFDELMLDWQEQGKI